MKRFITLFLMVCTLLTFTQKVMASAPLLSSENKSMMHCDMENMTMNSVNCTTEMVNMENCQSDCEMMTVVSVIHFIEDEQIIYFSSTKLHYSPLITPQPYSFSETLYRPPFLS